MRQEKQEEEEGSHGDAGSWALRSHIVTTGDWAWRLAGSLLTSGLGIADTIYTDTGLHRSPPHLRHHRPSGVCCPYWIMSPCLHPNQTCKPCFIRLECSHLKTFSDRKFQGPLLIKPLSAFWILYSPLFQTLLTFYMSHRYLLFRSQDKWTGNNNNGLTNNTN